MPRGGKRNGAPGKAYPQRTDLTTAAPIPGGQYGEQAQQAQVIQAMPTAPQAPVPPMPAGPAPGALGPLDRPTERPDEPMSAGAPWGPGPDSMGIPQPPGQDMTKLIRILPLLEQMANSPGSSIQTRQIYRNVLSAHLNQQG